MLKSPKPIRGNCVAWVGSEASKAAQLHGNIANGVQRLLLTTSFDLSEQIRDRVALTADAVDTVSEPQPMATFCVSDYRLIEHDVSITASVLWIDTVNTLVTKQWFRMRCRCAQGIT